jgi:hypothetical protein
MAAVLTIFLLLAPIFAGAMATAQQQVQTAPQRPASVRSASVVAATAEVLRETSEIRKLTILRPVKSGVQSRAEIERMIVKNLDEENSPEELRATELALKKFGLVPADFKLRPFLISLLTEQVAGYYDPKTREFYLADWIDIDGQRPVMVHELTHALQDQHFNLRRFEKWPKGDSDAELATQALVEGDATLAMISYISTNPAQAQSLFKRSLEAGAAGSEQMDRAPRALRESLLFPYEQGTAWVTQLYKRGGWDQVSKAFTALPQSTEQVLHADKYFAREAPVKVEIPDIAPALGAGWKRIDYDVNGEWGYYLILDEFLKSDDESRRAAAGWGGDRYALYEQAGKGETLIAQLTVWDTEADAREFFDAYARRTERRYRDARSLELPADDQAPGERRAWRTGEGGVLMARRGGRVLVIEGIPERVDQGKLLKSLRW